jgi:hypothetical protein
MQTPRHRTTGLALGVAAALAASASSDAGSSQAQDPEQLLRLAFSRRFDADLTSEIELVMRDRNGREHRRVFDAASKLIDGKHHSVGKLNWPVYLRDMTILTIEAEERDHDAFVYLPTLGRVRRISSSQKGDAFFGTDVTYEDLERRRVEDFEIVAFESTETHGEPSYRIRTQPREKLTYTSADYFVAAADLALLEMHYHKERFEGPFRIITSRRGDMIFENGHIVPTLMTVENLSRKTTTTATFRNLVLDPEIDDRLFSVTVLERNPELRNHTHAKQPR